MDMTESDIRGMLDCTRAYMCTRWTSNQALMDYRKRRLNGETFEQIIKAIVPTEPLHPKETP